MEWKEACFLWLHGVCSVTRFATVGFYVCNHWFWKYASMKYQCAMSWVTVPNWFKSFEYHHILSMRMSIWTERQTGDIFYKARTKCFVFVTGMELKFINFILWDAHLFLNWIRVLHTHFTFNSCCNSSWNSIWAYGHHFKLFFWSL